ncbi:MAG: YCF48-related protein [Terracidiphilus sp.]
MEAPVSSASDAAPSREPEERSGHRGSGARRQLSWLLSGIFLFIAATVAAFLQPPNPDPYALRHGLWSWFASPIERNAPWRVPSVGSNSERVFFVNDRRGWAVCASGTILSTSDGGQHWTAQSSGTTQSLNSVHFADSIHGWTVGDSGTILSTGDGGQHWTAQSSGTTQGLMSTYFTDSTHGWAVGIKGTILSTTDGGQHWTAQSSSTTQSFNSVHFADSSHGWAVGASGTILSTSDGGQHWTAQSSGTTQSLFDAHFADATNGWTVGNNGTILSTIDGGQHWTAQGSGTTQNLTSVHFADSSHGWAVGTSGTILSTIDGGQHWTAQNSSTTQTLISVQFTNSTHGWVVSFSGMICSTSDGGQHWTVQSSGMTHILNSVQFADSTHGWAVGSSGTILSTSDGGQYWTSQSSGTTQSLFDAHFADATKGWTVGNNGTILSTSDGGQHWTAQSSGTTQSLNSAHFADSIHGWAVGDSGTILSTIDGGQHWTAQSSGTTQGLMSTYFADSTHGWVVGWSGTILSTSDGGQHWTAQSSGTTQGLYSVQFADSIHGWAVGASGTILSTGDGGQHWTSQSSGTKQRLLDAHFADSTDGWTVGTSGTILSTSNGGHQWTAHGSGTTQDLNSVHFADSIHGWTVGDSGTILSTGDGGQRWINQIAPPTRYPAPWYYAAIVASLFLCWPSFAPVVLTPPVGAANRQITDNPIGPGDFDALGLGEIALGLSQFFRNWDTRPPLTVAVLGDWGQGKSSLMRLLAADLKKNGVSPVWFNAWHYQQEDHLLAYLMEAIRKQAVPRLMTLEGLRFRARLLGIRSARGRWTLGMLVVVAAFCAGVSIFHPEAAHNLTEWLGQLAEFREKQQPGAVRTIFDFLGQLTGHSVALAIRVGPFLLLAAQIWKSLNAFSVKPAAMIKEASSAASINDLSAKTSLRGEFARQFADAVKALEPYRLVIFIDDLDRCNPASVTQILEAVNFLVTAGECFVVLGLAIDKVEASVGLSFKDIADELGAGDDGKRTRKEYAQQYLRKLINLEVRVPIPTKEQREVLLTEGGPEAKPRPQSYADRLSRFLSRAKPLGWVAATIFFALGAFWLGRGWNLGSAPASAVPAEQISNPIPPPGTVGPTIGPGLSNPPPKESSEAGVFVPGQDEIHRVTWLPVVTGFLFLCFSVWVVTRRPIEIIRDSDDFNDALKLWEPVIGHQFQTPRELKRFVNRVRYVAMRWRRPVSRKTLGEGAIDWVGRLVARLRHRAPVVALDTDAAKSTDEDFEASVVAMAAVDGLGGETFLARAGDSDLPPLVKISREHVDRFGGLDWERYREITAEMKAN